MKPIIISEIKRLNYLTSEIDSAYHEAALKLGLSDSSIMILYTLCEHGGECLLSDITHISGVSRQTVNSSLRKLEQSGTVTTSAVDGKLKKVCLTDSGRAMAEKTAGRIIEIENKIFSLWPKQDIETYLELSQRYLTMLKDQVKEL